MNDWDGLNCPLPECGRELWLRYDKAFGLSGYNVNNVEGPDPADFDVSDWKVECLAGHVILVPTEYVDLDEENPEVVESDERRIFTSKDMLRLINLLNLDWDKVNG